MSKNKYGLDQFYTKNHVVDECLKYINLEEYDYVIEPSAGEGAFFKKIKNKNKIAFDIDPKSENIVRADFLKIPIDEYLNKKVITIGNPPFGNNSSLALKFIKKASYFSDTIAFILPKGFKKRSMIDKIPLNFEIKKIIDIDSNSFTYNNEDYDVPCVWVILKKTNKLRKKEIKLKPKKFIFTKKENANIAIRRVGVNAGKVFMDTNVSEQSHYFLSFENPIHAFEKIKDIEFSNNDTTGPRSIPKNELITKIEEIL